MGGKSKVDSDTREKIKILFVKGFLPCREISERLNGEIEGGISRQGVLNILNGMDINTRRSKITVPCDVCGTPVMKRRTEFRLCENHFCGPDCYHEWLRRPEVVRQERRMKAAREKCSMKFGAEAVEFAGIYIDGDDILMFKNRECMLEWMRTGFSEEVRSFKTGEMVSVCLKNGKVYRGEKNS